MNSRQPLWLALRSCRRSDTTRPSATRAHSIIGGQRAAQIRCYQDHYGEQRRGPLINRQASHRGGGGGITGGGPRRQRKPEVIDINMFGPDRKKFIEVNEASAGREGEDEMIREEVVCVVRGESRPSEPLRRQTALFGRRRDGGGMLLESLRKVAEPTREFPFAICKYVDLKEEVAREYERSKRTKASAVIEKRIEIGWKTTDHDLMHRLTSAQGFLGKGWKVEVLLGNTLRKGWMKRRAESEEAAEALLAKIRSTLLSVDGAHESQQARGKVGEEYCMVFKGRRPMAQAQLKEEGDRPQVESEQAAAAKEEQHENEAVDDEDKRQGMRARG